MSPSTKPLVEVVTDKVNAEVPSPFEGILREILVEEGATVPNNAEIAVIETAEDGATASAEAAAPAATEAAPSEPAAAEPAALPTRALPPGDRIGSDGQARHDRRSGARSGGPGRTGGQ